ncbi:hypothetical protein PSYMP_28373, partial [Pseudomonas amygdali pv. morsprunorum str. M302280]
MHPPATVIDDAHHEALLYVGLMIPAMDALRRKRTQSVQ